MSTPIRVLVVDDHAVVRAGLRMLLESGPGMSVVGEAGNRIEALAAAAREQPDIILLDLALGSDSALGFLPDLLVAASRARVLILTGVSDSELHRSAMRLGAMGLVFKEEAAETLIEAIKKVHAGELWLKRSEVAGLWSEMTRPQEQPVDPEAAKIAALTEREREVIALLCEGLKNREIARCLFLSEVTVRHHLTAIFAKLGVADRLDLLLYAYRHGLIRPPR